MLNTTKALPRALQLVYYMRHEPRELREVGRGDELIARHVGVAHGLEGAQALYVRDVSRQSRKVSGVDVVIEIDVSAD